MQTTPANVIRIGLLVIATVMLVSLAAHAVAPTEEAYEMWRQQGVLEQKIASWNAFKASGGCSAENVLFDQTRRAERLAAGINATDTLPVLVIMVDFSDNTFPQGSVNGTANIFDSILFSDKLSGGRVNPSGSMIDYYREISYGAIQIKGGVFGPFRMDSSYAWYEGGDDGFTRSPRLAYDAIVKANATIDYSQWDYNGIVKGVIILHPGAGAETSPPNTIAIWSHKSNVYGNPFYDGVGFSTYTVDPEEIGGQLQPIGVFCHEHGHIVGLPDLYDVDGTPATSEGLGAWSLMASGNYNGDSKYPAHPDPWCKLQLGWIPQPINVTANQVNVQIPAAEFNPVVYKIKAEGALPLSEYWLIENRQRIGSDYGLPGAGLLIYHIDPSRTGWGAPNIDYLRYGVGLEQADGLDQLALFGSRGDNADPWPGSTNNRSFTDQSVPNSHVYADTTTQVGVWNISNSDSIMTADLDYEFSRPYIAFDKHADSILMREAAGGNGDGTFDPGETIEFLCRISNTMRSAYGWSMTLATNNPDVEFLTNHVRQGLPGQSRLLMPQYNPNVANVPVTFRLKPGSKPSYTQFTLTILADSMYGTSDEKYLKSFQFTVALGTPQVLVVEDDNGTNADSVISSIFKRLNVPTRTWRKGTLGSPTGSDLSAFGSVFWIHGKKPTGTLTAVDVTGLKSYLDGGGNLCMASATAAKQLSTLDSAFMRDYLHARYIDTTSLLFMWFFGVNGGHLGDSAKYKYTGTQPQQQLAELAHMTNVAPITPALKAFAGSRYSHGLLGPYDTVGVTYSGTYKTVLLTFPIEFLTDAEMAGGWKTRDTILSRILGFFGGSSTSIEDPTEHNLPESFVLGQNFPNPFNPTTIITYTINPDRSGRAEKVDLSVFNLLGEKIITLVNEPKRPGSYAVGWNGTSSRGTKVASGVYFYRLSRGEQSTTRKMMLLK